jgi:hypothetical protein
MSMQPKLGFLGWVIIPQAQVIIETQLEIIYEPRTFPKALICPIQITGTLVICEKL